MVRDGAYRSARKTDKLCFEWLPEHAATGFFAFANPGPDRLMSSWFLAAVAEIAARTSPMYKLNWRVDPASPYCAVLDHLRATLPG